jgi:hypothetical protein
MKTAHFSDAPALTVRLIGVAADDLVEGTLAGLARRQPGCRGDHIVPNATRGCFADMRRQTPRYRRGWVSSPSVPIYG